MSRRGSTEKLDRLLERKGTLAERAAPEPLAERLRQLRAWQAARLAQTHADMLRDDLTRDAVSFFLTDLYRADGFARRDQELARAWRLLKRALPSAALEILSIAMELDVLSAELDLEMTTRLPPDRLTAQAYAETYRLVGREQDRRRQIELITEIGRSLARAVRSPLVGVALSAAHRPAHLAGVGGLQDFLERGFAAFRKLPDPERFLATIARREIQLMDSLLAEGTVRSNEAPTSGSMRQ